MYLLHALGPGAWPPCRCQCTAPGSLPTKGGLPLPCLLLQALSGTEMNRTAIVICHSFPKCWAKDGQLRSPGEDTPGCPCPSDEMVGRIEYRIGRTMVSPAQKLHGLSAF